MAPRILIVTTCRWFSAARIAMAFDSAGCAVAAICPDRHPVHLTRAGHNTYRYLARAPLTSIRKAIRSHAADIVVPCDDTAMHHLHRLYHAAVASDDENSRRLCQILQQSLGDPAGYAATGSRDAFMRMVNQLGVRAPETRTVESLDEVDQWLSRFGLPAVLKADGTSGGEGVKIVHTLQDARRAFRTLQAPVSAPVAAKRAFLDRDWTAAARWLAHRRRSVSIQSFIDGPDANMSIACWEGRILASITVEVLQTWRPKGPATIVRLLENRQMYEAAKAIVSRLKFSGLCGLDFLIDKTSGDATLIEMNARATQTCTLPLGSGRDLIAALCTAMSGQHFPDTSIALQGDTIALFPLAWRGDTSSELFRSAYHDVPWEEPGLVREGMERRPSPSHEKWKLWFTKIGWHEP